MCASHFSGNGFLDSGSQSAGLATRRTAGVGGNRSVTVILRRLRFWHLRARPTQCGLSEQVIPSLLPPRVTGKGLRGRAAERERF